MLIVNDAHRGLAGAHMPDGARSSPHHRGCVSGAGRPSAERCKAVVPTEIWVHEEHAPRADRREPRRKRAWELKQRGWTQHDIAAALGASARAVSQWLTRA